MENTLYIDTDNLLRPQMASNYSDAKMAFYEQESFYTREICVLVIAYNRLEKTKHCIESILEYTKDMNYQLVMVDNGSNDGTMDYYHSIDHPDKQIIRIEKNMGAGFAARAAYNLIDARYIAVVSNDMIVTSHWLSNLMTCMKSDRSIGMVCPVSSYVSNLQEYPIGSFTSWDEMQMLAKRHNSSDQKKWERRPRLISMLALYRTEMLDSIGSWVDLGFFHDFGEDELARRIHRSGYKMILCRDTYVHHDHPFTERSGESLRESIDAGRKDYLQKYHGIDAWDDVINYIFQHLGSIDCSAFKNRMVHILGLETRCGTPLMDLQNMLNMQDVKKYHISAFTTNAKYYSDLITITEDVTCDHLDYISNHYEKEAFEIVVFSEPINKVPYKTALIDKIYSLIKPGGYLLFPLKNIQDYTHYLAMQGKLKPTDTYETVTLYDCITHIEELGNDHLWISVDNYNNSYIDSMATSYGSIMKKIYDDLEEDNRKWLNVDTFWLLVRK